LHQQATASTGFDSFSNKVGNLRGLQTKNKFLVDIDSSRDEAQDNYKPKKGIDTQGEDNIGAIEYEYSVLKTQGVNVQIEEEGRILY